MIDRTLSGDSGSIGLSGSGMKGSKGFALPGVSGRIGLHGKDAGLDAVNYTLSCGTGIFSYSSIELETFPFFLSQPVSFNTAYFLQLDTGSIAETATASWQCILSADFDTGAFAWSGNAVLLTNITTGEPPTNPDIEDDLLYEVSLTTSIWIGPALLGANPPPRLDGATLSQLIGTNPDIVISYILVP